MPRIIVLSEVNPLGVGSGLTGESSSIASQAKNWYGIKLSSADFDSQILELAEYCNAHNYHLVIRDWSYCNFNPITKENPPYSFMLLKSLRKLHLNYNVIALVRNTYDIWISRACPNINAFSTGYGSYVKELQKINTHIYKYEDFCDDPVVIMKDICNKSGIPYSPYFIYDFKSFHKVNGDIQFGSKSSTLNEQQIKPLKRKYIHPFHLLRLIIKKSSLKRINTSLGYPVSFFDRTLGLSRSQYFRSTLIKIKEKCF